MKHVRLTLTAGGRETEIHPMYDLVTNAPYVHRATAIQWNFTGEEFGIMHHVEGDMAAFTEAVDSIQEVVGYDLAPAGDDAFYAYVRDETTSGTRTLFGLFTRKPVVVVPPVVYRSHGAACSVFGPAADIQRVIDDIPDPMTVEVQEVTGMAAMPGVVEPRLSDRQREAIDAALALGYYDIPRTGSHEDVADAMGCAPSTAAEHIRKAESKLVRTAIGT